MSQKLNNITPTYHSFAKNQVLTHKDLNEVIDYFEDQERLSRTGLSGVGIVCGFRSSYNANANILSITQGAGVTTDGDLVYFLFSKDGENTLHNPAAHNSSEIKIDLSVYTSFDDTKAKYGPFLDDLDTQIQLFELLPSSGIGTPLSSDFFENRTLILYVDCYSKEPGACTTISCDSQGIEEVRVIRVLAVNDNELDVLLKYDSIFNAHDIIEDYLDLKDVAVPRVILTEVNTNTVNSLSGEYYNALTDGDVVANLTANLEKISGRIGYDVSSLVTIINTEFINNPPEVIHYQYRYDLLKDLVDSYYELRDLFIENFPECCPDINAFPKHLLLGKLTNSLREDINNRHGFYPSPILTNQYSSRKHLTSILGRMLEMVNKFVSNVNPSSSIQITPSKLYKRLGGRAIPFYYDPQYDSNSESSLVRIWDFKRRTLKQYNRIQGYHQSAVSSLPSVAKPLEYNLDEYDFFRIEGHQGKLYNDALEEVNRLRDDSGLPFDTKILGISIDGSETVDISDYACQFEDIQGQLDMLIDTQNCVLSFASKFLSGYSISSEGANNKVLDLMGRGRPFVLNLNSISDFVRDDFASSGSSSSGGTGEVPAYTEPRSYQVSPESSNTSNRLLDTNNTSNSQYYIEDQSLAGSNQVNGSFQSYTVDDGQVVANHFAQELQGALSEISEVSELANLDNVIAKNLCATTNDLGSYILDGFQRFVGTDSAATYAYIKGEIDALRSGTASAWNADIADANLYFPAKILASAYAASLLIPTEMHSITNQLISNYNIEISRLCSYTRQWKTALGKAAVSGSTKISQDTKSLSELLNQSLTAMCCAGEKLQSLLDQIEDRKTSIRTNFQLSKFIEQHPGLEHKAGVPSGGTFVMVYAFDSLTKSAVQNGVVVADFALPYLCCSDCAPINFIVPRRVVSLLMSDSTVCIDTKDPAAQDIIVNLTISPSTGVVATTELFDGLSVVGDKVIISQTNFDSDNFGKPIEFTVDGQFTNATLVVSEKREIIIQSTPAIDSVNPTDTTFYTFIVNGASVNDDDIVWDFGDGTPLQTGLQVEHRFKLPVDTNPVTVMVNVTRKNGSECPAKATVDILFDAITVSLDKTIYCINDDRYKFTIIPEGANPSITGPGVTSDTNGKYFDPKEVLGDGTYTIDVENQSPIIVKVFDAPNGVIEQYIPTMKGTVGFNIRGEDFSNVQWSFHDLNNPNASLNVTYQEVKTGTIEILVADLERFKLFFIEVRAVLFPVIPEGETLAPCMQKTISTTLKLKTVSEVSDEIKEVPTEGSSNETSTGETSTGEASTGEASAGETK